MGFEEVTVEGRWSERHQSSAQIRRQSRGQTLNTMNGAWDPRELQLDIDPHRVAPTWTPWSYFLKLQSGPQEEIVFLENRKRPKDLECWDVSSSGDVTSYHCGCKIFHIPGIRKDDPEYRRAFFHDA